MILSETRVLNELNVGDSVFINENGAAAEFLIAHKGRPSDDYDENCDGVWLMRKGVVSSGVKWDGRSTYEIPSNEYKSSRIKRWLENEYFSRLDENVSKNIMSVNIPYTSNGILYTKENGLSCKIFLLSLVETKGEQSNSAGRLYYKREGSGLDLFSAADSSRGADDWHTRTPNTYGSEDIYYIRNGRVNSGTANSYARVRPAFILPANSEIGDDNFVTGTLKESGAVIKFKLHLDFTEVDYDGKEHAPKVLDENGGAVSADIFNIYGTLSGTAACADGEYYYIYVGFKESPDFIYQWEDGTSDDITLSWRISRAAFPKPVLSRYEFDYTGNGSYNGSNYKLPSVNGFVSDVMTRDGTGLTKQYKAGNYPIVFSLKDPDSCSWDDGSTDNYTVTWVIRPKIAPIPRISSGDIVYDGTAHSPAVENADLNIMSQSGNTGYVNAGDYYITYTLRDPDSCSWEDGTVSQKTVYWSIAKQTVYIDKPYLAEGQAEFEYDGRTHTPVIANRDDNKMTVTGTVSSVAANTADAPFWLINIALKATANYVYKWNTENEEDNSEENRTRDVVLKWVVHKGIFDVPEVSPVRVTYNGNSVTVTVSGYKSYVMTQSGTLRASAAAEYTLIYSLKDKNSASWRDGSVEDKKVSWFIDKRVLPVPSAVKDKYAVIYGTPYSSGGKTYMTFKSQNPELNDFDSRYMSISGDGKNSPGKYTAVIALKDKTSTVWDDGSTGDVAIDWEILKIEKTYDKPSLDPVSFIYDGTEHSPALKNYTGGFYQFEVMKKDGVLTARKAGKYAVDIKFSDADSDTFLFKWSDGTAEPVKLEWEIEKANFVPPSLSPVVFKYDGTVHSPVVTGFNADTMRKSEDSVLSASAVGEYTAAYSLTDADSASWSDGSVDNIVLNWRITESDPVKTPGVSPLEFTYDGSVLQPRIEEYDENLISVSGTLSETDAGGYSLTFSLKDKTSAYWDDGTVGDKVVKWVIKKQIKRYEKPSLVPETAEFDYNGSERKPELIGFDGSVMDPANVSAVKAGEYTAVISFKEHKNYEYRWSDDSAEPVALSWRINRITVSPPRILTDSFYYGGYSDGYHFISHAWRQPEITGYIPDIMNGVGVTDLHAIISNEWNVGVKTEKTGKYYGDYQWGVGKYYVEFTFKDPDSCAWSDGDADKIIYEWSIVREIKLLEKPYLINSAFEYDGTEKEPVVTNGDVRGVVVDGDTKGVAAGEYTIVCAPYRYKDAKDIYDYRWADNTVAEIPLVWNITPGTAEIPDIEPKSFVYDGREHLPVISGFNGDMIRKSGDNAKTKAGEYEIVFSLIDPGSCVWADGTVENKALKWRIERASVKKPTLSPEFMMYDGETHTVEFAGNESDRSFVVDGYNADIMTCGGSLNGIGAGEYRTVIKLRDPESCSWTDGSVGSVELLWEIRKKTVLLDKPYLEPKTFLFDGENHSPDIVRWKNAGMYVKNGSVRSALHSGKYKITLCLSEDSNITYLWGDPDLNSVGGELELDWEITKAAGENGLEKPFVTGLEYVYDKNYHTPEISGYNTVLIKQDGTTTAWQKGVYTIKFSLKYPEDSTWKDGTPGDVKYTWRITKPVQTVELPRLDPDKFVYDAKSYAPEVKDLDPVLKVKSNEKQTAAGKYFVTVGFGYNVDDSLIDYTWADGSVGDIELPWEIIQKRDLKKPDITPVFFEYDGERHIPEIVDLDEDFAVCEGLTYETASGVYTVVFRLKDRDSCLWADGSSENISRDWEITATVFEKPVVTELEFVYDAAEHGPVVSGYNGNAILQSGVLTAADAGEYLLTFSLKDKNSSAWSDGSVDDVVYSWRINKAVVEKPRIRNNSFTYNAGVHTPAVTGFDPELMVQDGVPSAVNAGGYHIYIEIKDEKNYEWTDGGAERLDLEWFIRRRPVEKPYIAVDSFGYTGNVITPVVSGFRSGAMEYAGGSVGSAVIVGDYKIVIRLGSNYEWTDGTDDNIVLDWHITKALVSVPKVSGLLFAYDGTAHSPEIGDYDVNAVLRSGTESAVNAGDYRIVFSLRDKEHCQWETLSSEDIAVDWRITKIILSRPAGLTLHFVYNGGWRLPVIDGLNENYMRFEGSDREINAGNYSYKVILKDKVNFAWDDGSSDDIVFLWDIGRKPVDVLRLEPDEFEYDGTVHKPLIRNFNGEIMEIAPHSGSVTSARDVGEYKITILLGDRVGTPNGGYYYLRNYEWKTGGIDNITLNWRVVPKTLGYPSLTVSEFVYDGEPHSPAVDGYIPSAMAVVGTIKETNAGIYELGFRLTDTARYKWADGVVDGLRYDWKINKAVLSADDIPVQEPVLVYNGGEQTPSWSNFDRDKWVLKHPPSATNAGTYTARFSPGGNYAWADGSVGDISVDWVIEKLELNIPVQYNALYYNGEEQEPVWLVTYRS